MEQQNPFKATTVCPKYVFEFILCRSVRLGVDSAFKIKTRGNFFKVVDYHMADRPRGYL